MEETRTEKNDDGGIDRLSNLPDAMLLHILSFLPTLTSVNTMSLVSHRYRYLWKHLEVLNVDEEDFHNLHINHHKLFTCLSLFVNGFLARRKSRNIHKFRLFFNLTDLDDDQIPAPYIDTWIRTAIGPHLQELHLDLFSDQPGAFNFSFNILFSCPNLVSLSLCCDMLPQMQLLCSSSAVCFPLLKKLDMHILREVDVFEVDVLLSGCPILETLELSLWPLSLKTLRVPHSLKSLTFTVDNEDVGVCLEIDAPSLKYLSLIGVTFGGNAIGNLNKVEEAYLDFHSLPDISVCLSFEPIHNLLRALSGIKRLFLNCSTTKSLFDEEFLEFRHLIHLKLILPCFNIGFLYNVLQKCPMLQVLKIKMHEGPLPPQYGWVPKPKSVPNCLLSHLTFIHFVGCQGYLDEIKFIRYVLRKGLVLKTMHISSLSKEKDGILTQFSNTPRGSVSCQLQFD